MRVYNTHMSFRQYIVKDTVAVYFVGRHRCCKNVNKFERRLCIGRSVRTLGFIDDACTCHQAVLLRGRNSIVILDGNLISSCQSKETIIHTFNVKTRLFNSWAYYTIIPKNI